MLYRVSWGRNLVTANGMTHWMHIQVVPLANVINRENNRVVR